MSYLMLKYQNNYPEKTVVLVTCLWEKRYTRIPTYPSSIVISYLNSRSSLVAHGISRRLRGTSSATTHNHRFRCNRHSKRNVTLAKCTCTKDKRIILAGSHPYERCISSRKIQCILFDLVTIIRKYCFRNQ